MLRLQPPLGLQPQVGLRGLKKDDKAGQEVVKAREAVIRVAVVQSAGGIDTIQAYRARSVIHTTTEYLWRVRIVVKTVLGLLSRLFSVAIFRGMALSCSEVWHCHVQRYGIAMFRGMALPCSEVWSGTGRRCGHSHRWYGVGYWSTLW